MKARRDPIVILGAGLAGLSAALRARRGYRLFEQRETVGGLAETVEEGGFRFDRTGHLLHLSQPRALRLVRNMIGDELLEIGRRSRIWTHGVYTRYPFQANLDGLPPEIAAECLEGFVRAWAARGGERVGSRRFDEFARANFGEGIARHFMVPYNRKLWGVDPAKITDAWCDRFVPVPELGEVIGGAVGLPQEGMGYNAVFHYPLGGIGRLADEMARRVGRIETGRACTAVDFEGRRARVKGSWEPYRALISSLPLDRLIGSLVDPPKRIAAAGRALRCAGLRYLDVALERPPGTPHHWCYVPERRYPFYRVGAYSEFSESMAPPGKGALYVELASRRPVDLDRLRPRLISGLVEMGIIEAESDVAFIRPRWLGRAYVLYDARYRSVRDELIEWLEKRGIFPVGRYGRWEYAAMEDALVQGMDAADRAREE